ncbi:3-methyladenine DNA glycosylase [Leifsonia sp. A12D58]|uniref:3-methyladenine DNA glycosylase n=1 Tax=Leifsonia sp. A12D58 TaxID=3397674 RepID=UPI0039DFBF02
MVPLFLDSAEWRALEQQHQQRADALSLGRRQRVERGETHPVNDFLFTYYPLRPGLLRRWHPGAGVVLVDAAGDERGSWKWYRSAGTGGGTGVRGDSDLEVDTTAFLQAKARTITFITTLLADTIKRTPNFGCFGLHEWAMVFRQGEHRHEAPLRIGQAATDEVVVGSRIACSHFDAYRFFTPAATGLNALSPTRENQPELEQSGCLHAGMDVYKWAIKLGPLIPGDLLLDCFDLAADIRQLDMRASPYDLSAWGYESVAVETPTGKADYVRQQRGFAARGNVLRQRVIDAVALAGARPLL